MTEAVAAEKGPTVDPQVFTLRQVSRLFEAIVFANERHCYQKRDDAKGTPYIAHCLEVAQILFREARVTETDILIGAMLHDVVEDTDTSLAEISARFDDAVAGVVGEVTDPRGLDKATRRAGQIERLKTASIGAKCIKLANKIANCRDLARNPPPGWDLKRQSEYFHFSWKVMEACREGSRAQEDHRIGRLCTAFQAVMLLCPDATVSVA